jgi:hypothetical protein
MLSWLEMRIGIAQNIARLRALLLVRIVLFVRKPHGPLDSSGKTKTGIVVILNAKNGNVVPIGDII